MGRVRHTACPAALPLPGPGDAVGPCAALSPLPPHPAPPRPPGASYGFNITSGGSTCKGTIVITPCKPDCSDVETFTVDADKNVNCTYAPKTTEAFSVASVSSGAVGVQMVDPANNSRVISSLAVGGCRGQGGGGQGGGARGARGLWRAARGRASRGGRAARGTPGRSPPRRSPAPLAPRESSLQRAPASLPAPRLTRSLPPPFHPPRLQQSVGRDHPQWRAQRALDLHLPGRRRLQVHGRAQAVQHHVLLQVGGRGDAWGQGSWTGCGAPTTLGTRAARRRPYDGAGCPRPASGAKLTRPPCATPRSRARPPRNGTVELKTSLICIPLGRVAGRVATAAGNTCSRGANHFVHATSCSPSKKCVINDGKPASGNANSVCVKANRFGRKISLKLKVQAIDRANTLLGPESPEYAITLYKRERSVPSDLKASCVAVGTL
jgi:hypothetical protein